MKTLLKNCTLVLADGCRQDTLEITDSRITYIGPERREFVADRIIDAGGRHVLPGFIDLHSNGLAGFDCSNGLYTSDLFSTKAEDYVRGMEQAAQAYAANGTTAVLLSSIATPFDQLLQVFGHFGGYRVSEAASFLVKNVLAGLYIEGTFMKDPAFRGAHNSDYFIRPDIAVFQQLQEQARGLIAVVNVVPEWGDAAWSLMQHLQTQGVVIACGHSGADNLLYEEAVRHGMRLAVHLFNGPTPVSFKSFNRGAALEAILRSKEISAELILDGIHVDAAYVLDAIRRKGVDRIIGISDSMFATCLPDLREFSIFGVTGQVSEDARYLQAKGRPNTLFGGNITMAQAFNNLLNWFTRPMEGVWYELHEALAPADALVRASRICSTNPARLMGWDRKGALAAGKEADLVIVSLTNAADGYQLHIEEVLIQGQTVFSTQG